MALTKAQASTILTRLGFRVNTPTRYMQALMNFQRGWNLGAALKIDGIKGPSTDSALLLSESRRAHGLGTASAHFSFMEVRCKCGGNYVDCQRIWIRRSVFASLEGSRRRIGRSITITSGCRCPNYNRDVKGSLSSRHKSGDAVDWKGPDKDIVRSWRIWRGVGYGSNSDCALHTDLRPTASVISPTMWVYPGW